MGRQSEHRDDTSTETTTPASVPGQNESEDEAEEEEEELAEEDMEAALENPTREQLLNSFYAVMAEEGYFHDEDEEVAQPLG